MKKVRRPLARTTAALSIFFILIFTAGVTMVTYQLYSQTIYIRYQRQMDSIITYIESFIDNDDMSECAETYVESETYKKTREVFDHFVDFYPEVHYLYIIKPNPPGDPVKIVSILSANTTYEKTYTPETMLFLGDGEENWYTEESAQKYRTILAGTRDVFFEDTTLEWGTDYTMARPLINSEGKHYALLCVDISIGDIQNSVNRNININIMFMLMIGALFIVFLLLWLRWSVITPVRELENSLANYINSSHNAGDPDDLEYFPPDIHTKNEVESLKDTVVTLTTDMKSYAKSLKPVDTEKKAIQSHPVKMHVVPLRDPLTGLKNRAAYDKKVKELNRDILCNQAEFCLVRADLNDLGTINETCGRDKGDEYILGAAKILEKVFQYSPIYRIDGDELVVVAEDSDYVHRKDLIEELSEALQNAASSDEKEPWLRVSCAFGAADYDRNQDTNVDPVFARAGEEMKKNKMEMKQ